MSQSLRNLVLKEKKEKRSGQMKYHKKRKQSVNLVRGIRVCLQLMLTDRVYDIVC